jgi:hypothetical protein
LVTIILGGISMKKLPLSTALITSVVYLAGCSASNTQVRLLELSYSLPGTQTEAARLNEGRLSAKRNADTEEYFFPGDVLTFTVELEDPNFEFISLLAIKFNGVTIRANTNDSIVTTSDCGANICVNFPFEVSADVTEYTVEEVKFAKLNGDSGINAIIDNQSQNTLILDIYNEPVSPYVSEAVTKLNQLVSNSNYFDIISTNVSAEEIYTETNQTSNDFDGRHGNRILFINNFEYSEELLITFDTFQVEFNNAPEEEPAQFINFVKFTQVRSLDTNPIIFKNLFVYGLLTIEYENTTFYKDESKIYMTANGQNYFIIEFQSRTRMFFGEELGYSSVNA